MSPYSGPFKTREDAADRLETLFARGEISEGERPNLQLLKCKIRGTNEIVRRWYVCLPA